MGSNTYRYNRFKGYTAKDCDCIHGQVINGWLTKVKPTHILIVDDELPQDELMSNMYKALSPRWLDVEIFSTEAAVKYLADHMREDWRILLMAKTPCTFEKLVRLGCKFEEIVIADKRYLPNKKNISIECKRSINFLLDQKIHLTVQEFPEDTPYKISFYAL